MIKRFILFVVTTILLVVLSSCDAPVIFVFEENPINKTETIVPIGTDVPTDNSTLVPTNTFTPVPTSTPTPTAIPTPEYLGFPMTPAGETLTQIIRDIEEFKSIEVVPCSNFADEYELLSNLPPVIYQGETWSDSYCIDSLVIDREPGQEYTIFGAVVETYNMVGFRGFEGKEDGFHVVFLKSELPLVDFEGVKGLELWKIFGLTKEFLLKVGRITSPYLLFGIEESDYEKYIDKFLYSMWTEEIIREVERKLP